MSERRAWEARIRMNSKICFRIALIIWNIAWSFVAAVPAYSQPNYTGIVIIEAVPWNVREQCMNGFIAESLDWGIKRPLDLSDAMRAKAADWAFSRKNFGYSLKTPKGPYAFTCVGLVESAYEKTTTVNLTSDADEQDGCWPHFFPTEQMASPLLQDIGKPERQDLKKGDIIYRESRGVWILPNILIPGAVDHVGIIYAIEDTLTDNCQPYNYQSEYEVCDDQVDNDKDGWIDAMDPDCGGNMFTILQDSITLVERSQTQAYIPFSICNAACWPLTINYRITSRGHIGPFIDYAGTVSVTDGDCEDVYGIVDAGMAVPCTFDTLTIVAWTTVGEQTYDDTCVQIIHVVEPEPVANFTPPFIAILAFILILIAAIFIRKRPMSMT